MSKLGILVNTDKYRDDVVGIVKAAKEKGHDAAIFMMDDGTLLAENLCGDLGDGVEVTYCDHSAEPRGIKDVEGATAGSQFQNAVMVHESDKVVVF
jgi:sulfur relay (sulfurtransferase) complex TusBCD TusD component (DsrE family)